MRTKHLRRIRLGRPRPETHVAPLNWLWHGYLRPGTVTLLTSRWKTGKTTLVAGLLRALGPGTPFLDRPTRPARAWVLAEEDEDLWFDRDDAHPIGDHVEILPNPYPARPTAAEWADLIDDAADAHTAGELDLLVIDPLAHFLPGHCESNALALLDALRPLRRLSAAGAAVLLLHHPGKKPAEEGESARGSGALPGFVDVVMELNRYGKLKTDHHRRCLFARSRRPETPERLAYERDATTDEFRTVLDPRDRQFAENWVTVEGVLRSHSGPMTCGDIAAAWPDDAAAPCQKSLYLWLHAAHARQLVVRTGRGTKTDPYRFRLRTTQDDADDRFRASLPPVPELPPWGE
jgi:hypothetical protein